MGSVFSRAFVGAFCAYDICQSGAPRLDYIRAHRDPRCNRYLEPRARCPLPPSWSIDFHARHDEIGGIDRSVRFCDDHYTKRFPQRGSGMPITAHCRTPRILRDYVRDARLNYKVSATLDLGAWPARSAVLQNNLLYPAGPWPLLSGARPNTDYRNLQPNGRIRAPNAANLLREAWDRLPQRSPSNGVVARW